MTQREIELLEEATEMVTSEMVVDLESGEAIELNEVYSLYRYEDDDCFFIVNTDDGTEYYQVLTNGPDVVLEDLGAIDDEAMTQMEFNSLMIMYRTLRDTDEILESDFYDPVAYDVDGYAGLDDDEIGEYIEDLRKQVSEVSKLVIAMKGLNFKFG